MFYERLTKRGDDHALHVFDINDREISLSEVTALDIDLIAGHLVFLEDKIESGELVNRNEYLDHLMSAKTLLELTDKEIDFFVEHNTRMRKFVKEDITRLTSENQRLKKEVTDLQKRLDNAIELPCKVGDTIYEATKAGIYEWEVESVYLRKNLFQANCVNKKDYKMHWNFIKADYCNDFEGKGKVRVNRLEAEARLAELKGDMQ